MEVGGTSEKDKFVKMLCTAAESCGPELLKKPAIYALCERKKRKCYLDMAYRFSRLGKK